MSGENKVLETTKLIIENPKYVFINNKNVEELAEKWSKENLEIPGWEMPVYLSGKTEEVIDSFFLGDSINFAYTDFDTGEKWSSEYKGKEWKGAFGMWASLKKAIEEGMPILDGNYLKEISEKEMRKIFEGNFEIPMFNERLNIFREIGNVLSEKYDGHFYNLIEESNGKLFSNGKGIVEKLTSDFPSFDDSVVYKGKKVRFDKRAQLAPGTLYGRFRAQGETLFWDVDELTVFSDYVLPKGLRDLKILTYEKSLEEKVDNQNLIEAASLEELEIRASTIHAAKRIQDKINEYRKGENPVNALHIDYKLWAESRVKPGFHHLTKTIAY
ncbi:MAG: queuosine salvage family protein [Nanoarchaeota archaeon]|nr:queuosine salvage family protein [Nanoarchaeota archaeon]